MKAFYQHSFSKEQCRMGSSLAYNLHFHHQIEAVFMFEGRAKAIVDGREYELVAGDTLVVFPNQLHEYKVGEGEQYFITIFSPELLPDFKDIFYGCLPENNVYSTECGDSLLYDIAKKLPEVKVSDNKYKEQMFRGLITAFFGYLLSKMTLIKAKSGDLSVVRQILNYCNENYKSDISLSDVADHLHVSKYYVSHLLNDRLNISFSGYLNSLRVADAVTLLENGKNDMTEVAQLSGFNTARTFNRAFKEVYGMSPSTYRKIKY